MTPIEVTESGIWTVVRPLQREKASSPIEVQLLGMTTSPFATGSMAHLPATVAASIIRPSPRSSARGIVGLPGLQGAHGRRGVRPGKRAKGFAQGGAGSPWIDVDVDRGGSRDRGLLRLFWGAGEAGGGQGTGEVVSGVGKEVR